MQCEWNFHSGTVIHNSFTKEGFDMEKSVIEEVDTRKTVIGKRQVERLERQSGLISQVNSVISFTSL
jgi:hypothetical protein